MRPPSKGGVVIEMKNKREDDQYKIAFEQLNQIIRALFKVTKSLNNGKLNKDWRLVPIDISRKRIEILLESRY